MGQKIKKIWEIINVLLIAVILFLAIALAGVKLIGWDVYVVLSGSMEPTYKTGAVLYVDDVDTSTLQAGDPVTYVINGDVKVTHRIVEVVKQDGQTFYKTKGDANNVEDGGLVAESQVIGAPVFSIPYLGHLVTFIQGPAGIFAMIAFGAAMLLMMFLPEMLFGDEDDEEDERDEKEEKAE
ncbi:MAG: signal peptidase I [Firmicutes bacterium]|nr:signal peptidase I [Bacillota bacterium]